MCAKAGWHLKGVCAEGLGPEHFTKGIFVLRKLLIKISFLLEFLFYFSGVTEKDIKISAISLVPWH